MRFCFNARYMAEIFNSSNLGKYRRHLQVLACLGKIQFFVKEWIYIRISCYTNFKHRKGKYSYYLRRAVIVSLRVPLCFIAAYISKFATVAILFLSYLAMLIKGRNGRDSYLASSDIVVVQKKKVVMLLLVEKLNALTFNLNCCGFQVVSVCTKFCLFRARNTFGCNRTCNEPTARKRDVT